MSRQMTSVLAQGNQTPVILQGIQQENLTITTLEIAEMMEVPHYDVLKKLEGTIKSNGDVKQVGIIPTLTKGKIPVSDYFVETTYIDGSGKKNKCYDCTKMGCELLANKFTGEKGIIFSAKYVERFNKMEDYIIKNKKQDSYMIDDPIKRAERWIEEQKEKQLLTEQNAILQLQNKQQEQVIREYGPKITYYDMVLQSPNLITITQIAKDYGMSAKKMNETLHELAVQYKQSGTWLLYSKYANKGYTKSETYVDQNTGYTRLNTKWTQKGRLFIYDLLKQNDIRPLIES